MGLMVHKGHLVLTEQLEPMALMVPMALMEPMVPMA